MACFRTPTQKRSCVLGSGYELLIPEFSDLRWVAIFRLKAEATSVINSGDFGCRMPRMAERDTLMKRSLFNARAGAVLTIAAAIVGAHLADSANPYAAAL